MTLKYFISETHADGIEVLKINRPKAMNALNTETMVEFRDYLKLCAHNRDLRVLILTGTGEKAFIAGADIEEMKTKNHSEATQFSQLGHEIARLLETMHKVTIAAVNGYALGGGTEMALACDFILASDSAVFGLPEVSLGVIPGFGGTVRLSKAVGLPRAKELIFSGNRITADEALRIGLVTHVYPRDDLLPQALELAKKISRNSMTAILRTKRLLNEFSESHGLHYKMDSEIQEFGRQFGTYDQKEGMNAFSEKRKPLFEGLSLNAPNPGETKK